MIIIASDTPKAELLNGFARCYSNVIQSSVCGVWCMCVCVLSMLSRLRWFSSAVSFVCRRRRRRSARTHSRLFAVVNVPVRIGEADGSSTQIETEPNTQQHHNEKPINTRYQFTVDLRRCE